MDKAIEKEKATLDSSCHKLTELINENRALIENLKETAALPEIPAPQGGKEQSDINIDCLEAFFDEATNNLHRNNIILRNLVEKFSQYINTIKILS